MDTQFIVDHLLDWYALHYRPLPWRQEPTPYRVWISEIMLQQTRIEAVLPYFHRFISALPDVYALAGVEEEMLLKLWEGLGYYSRARNLKRAAKVIVDEYEGTLPADYDRLVALPGIGPYTAGAIASIAYNLPAIAVDGNVMRVLARLTGDDTDVLSAAGKNRFSQLARELLPAQQPGRFNQALMELGETICVPGCTPRCENCPLAVGCVARQQGRQGELPVRIKKTKRRIEYRSVLVVRIMDKEPHVLLHKRPETGLLAGLWELPNCLVGEPLLPETILAECGTPVSIGCSKHLFSHVEWRMAGFLLDLPCGLPLPPDYRAVTLEELQSVYPLPSAFRYYAAQLPQLLNKGE